MTPLTWKIKNFDQLTPKELYGILKLRIQVFMIEQECGVTETDDHDQLTMHLFAMDGQNIIACARIFEPDYYYHGEKCENARIGRIVVDQSLRGTGIGFELTKRALDYIDNTFASATEISAQAHLKKFYEKLNFISTGDEYLEDSIPHVRMVRERKH